MSCVRSSFKNTYFWMYCSKTTLTGESRYHVSIVGVDEIERSINHNCILHGCAIVLQLFPMDNYVSLDLSTKYQTYQNEKHIFWFTMCVINNWQTFSRHDKMSAFKLCKARLSLKDIRNQFQFARASLKRILMLPRKQTWGSLPRNHFQGLKIQMEPVPRSLHHFLNREG